MRKIKLISILCLSLVMAQGLCFAADYYVDPVNGSMSNDGSYESPWSTIQEVFENNLIEMKVYAVTPYANDPAGEPTEIKNPGAPVKSGDTLYLRSGYHGEIWERGTYNDDYITITAEDGHTPVLKRIFLSAGRKWIIRGLTITPSAAPVLEKTTMLMFESHGWHGPCYDYIFEDNDLYSTEDTSAWTAQDWNDFASAGIASRGANAVIRNNRLTNVNFGIVITGDNTIVEKNRIEHIAGDGIVVGADNVTLQYNKIKYFYKVNGNHDDGIQFHRGTNVDRIPMKNIVLRGNIIICHDPNPTNPLLGSPQGIGCFDMGMYENWVVENNLVVVDHWHGISVYGAIDSRIVNNTVYNFVSDRQIWISLGGGGSNTIVRNNIAIAAFNYSGGENITADHNISLRNKNAEDYFVDIQNLDFNLKADSPAVDAGASELASQVDIRGVQRPYGGVVDIGAYEYDPDEVRMGFPSAYFISSPNNIEVSLDIVFDASASGDVDGYIVSYEWDFGDGTEGRGNIITHAFPRSGEYLVKLIVTDNDGKKGEYKEIIVVSNKIDVLADTVVEVTALKCYNNRINPAKGERAIIRLELKEDVNVSLILYNSSGKKVKQLVNGAMTAGTHNIYWGGEDGSGKIVGSGIYIVRIEAGGYKENKKIAVVK